MERLLTPQAAIWSIGLLVGFAVLIWLRRWLIDHDWLFGPDDDRRALGTAAANALAEIESLYVPAMEHVLEMRRHEDEWERFLQAGTAEPHDVPEGA